MNKVIRLKNLDCANCALKLERAIAKIDGVKSVSVNFIYQKVFLEYESENPEFLKQVKQIAKNTLSDVEVIGIWIKKR